MNTANTFSNAESHNQISTLIHHINATANALLIALDASSEQIGQYGWSVVQKMDGEFADRFVFALLRLKYHLYRLEREVQKGCIHTQEDLEHIVGGLQETYDLLWDLMISDGSIRNQFKFGIDELRDGIIALKNRLPINSFSHAV